jgi:acyl-coenzyme A thioesterase PaaI-like protein
VFDFPVENLSAEDVERLRRIYEPLTEAVRELIDATIRTQVDAGDAAAAQAAIEAATARLRTRQSDGAFGVCFSTDGDQMPWGNAVVGMRNPIAPPVVIETGEDGAMFADVHLGAAYEGPPGHVHGGVAALILDHILGAVASPLTKPRLTGTISLRYVRMTPLGDVRAEARIVRSEGVKTYAAGFLATEGGVTVEAEGVFIAPRWARD